MPRAFAFCTGTAILAPVGRMLAIVVGAILACFVVFLIIDRVYSRSGAFVATIVVFLLIAGVVGYLDRRARAGFDDDD